MKNLNTFLASKSFGNFSRLFLFVVVRLMFWSTIIFLLMMELCKPEIINFLEANYGFNL